MLSKYNPVIVDYILNQESAPPPFPPASNREAWNAVRERIGQERYDELIAGAEAASRAAIPPLTAVHFLEFFRSGDRAGYEALWFSRRTMLEELTLAECLEFQGRFLDPLLSMAWAICEESSWEFPAHHYDLPDVERPVIGLFSAITATQLAEVVLLLGEQIHPLLEKRIRFEADQRIITPFLTRHDFWWLHPCPGRDLNNWTAVCVGNVIATAIYLERNTSRLAEVIARGASSLDDYLATFDSEGGSTEGPAYWDFGFGNFVLAAHLVHQRSNGIIDFFAEPIVGKIAQFPLRTSLSPRYFVNFSDCDATAMLSVPLLAFLGQQLEMEDLIRLGNRQSQYGSRRNNSALSWALRDLFWYPETTLGDNLIPANEDWFPDIMWMLARYEPQNPDALVLAAKGGHNDEMHNQNDVGNFIVHVNQTSVIADVGRGRYTRIYFADATRYDHFVNSSMGHSVPVVNGQLQLTGRSAEAKLLKHRSDEKISQMVLEMKDAYPSEAKLMSLKRQIALHRQAPRGWVELIHDVEFDGEGTFESPLTTFGTAQIEPNCVHITDGTGALDVQFDAQALPRHWQQVLH
jgi:hypothetical protein